MLAGRLVIAAGAGAAGLGTGALASEAAGARAGAPLACKLLVLGGGAGGCSVAAKFARRLGEGGCVIVEPADTHYYQPMWTMVGGGMKTVAQSARPMANVLPKEATWVKDAVARFMPDENKVVTADGREIRYEYMVVALGLELRYELVPGLQEALAADGSGVCSNYSHRYADRTYRCVRDFQRGNAVFTFPNTPVKCAGAPQKAAYISDALMRKLGKRDRASIKYNTSLPSIFGCKHYADRLWKVCADRGIEVGVRQELIEIKADSKEAVFKNLDNESLTKVNYEMLHVTPPMSAPAALRRHAADSGPGLTDAAGFLAVDRRTLRHDKFANVFGIGDCTNLPTSKTAAAVAGQTGVLAANLSAVMRGAPPPAAYDGYTSCPLVTSLDKCILAEFDYDLKPLETFSWDQGVERFSSFLLKKEVMPVIYWHGLLKGRWNGPAFYRKVLHLQNPFA